MSNGLIEDLLGEQEEIRNSRQKQQELFINDVQTRHQQMQIRKEEEEKLSKIDLSVHNTQYYEQIAKDSKEHLTSIRHSGVFLDDAFRDSVSFFGKNLILVMATTGDGKTTLSANLGHGALRQGQRVLMITNEENVQDMYNRVTCFFRGWTYNNHKDFTDDQINHFSEMIIKLSKKMTVVDDNYNGATGVTTTLEGVQAILESTLKPGNEFDVIIVDYYQNITRSNKMPQLDQYTVQDMFSKWLKQFIKRSPAPVVVLAQRKPRLKEQRDYKEALEGRKSIANDATIVIEIQAERDLYRTAFTIRKTRFPDSLNKTIYMGFERGRYVSYNEEFKQKALEIKEAQARKELLSKTRALPGGSE